MDSKILNVIDKMTAHSTYYRLIIGKYGLNNLPMEMISGKEIFTQKFQILDNRISPIQAESLYTYRSFCNRCEHELEILWSYNDIQKIERSLYRKRKFWYNVSCADKFCRNHQPGRGKNPFRTLDDIYFSPHKNFVSFSIEYDKQNDWERCLYYMDIFQPVWICFEDTFFKGLYKYIGDFNLAFPSSIKFAEIRSRVIPPVDYYNKLPFEYTVVLYDPVVAEFAYKCPMNQFHLLEDLIYAEYPANQYERGTIVTSLSNSIFPIIRYSIPLVLHIETLNCECGECGSIVKI